jgi:hypothetical protein
MTVSAGKFGMFEIRNPSPAMIEFSKLLLLIFQSLNLEK